MAPQENIIRLYPSKNAFLLQLFNMSEVYSSDIEKNEVALKVQQQPASDPNNSGRWTDEENFKYVMFLDKNKQRFSCRLKRRKIRLFEQMAEFIGSRSSIQCRTHHQKYEQKFGDTKAIVNIYKEEVGFTNFKKMVRDLITKGVFTKPQIQDPPSQQIKVQAEQIQQPPFKEAYVQTDPVKGLPELGTLLNTKQQIPTISHIWFPYYY